MKRLGLLPTWCIFGFALAAGCAWPRGKQGAPAIDGDAALEVQALGEDLVRLPEDVRPLSYRLKLSVDPNQAAFRGSLTLTAKLRHARRNVYLHGRGLRVKAVMASAAGLRPVLGSYSQMNDDGLAVVRFAAPLPAGEVSIEVLYEAPFGTHLDGLHRVGLGDAAGPYVVSQFEPTSARTTFPCLDEPRFKAPFEVTLVVPTGMRAISNMPCVSEQVSSDELNFKQVNFLPSPPLPTYLLAIMVGNFDVVDGPPIPADGRRVRDIPLRGIAARGQGAKLSYALQHTGRLVQILEDAFDLALPFPKLDLIAVPDFAAGAMENPGAITFRDWLLLIDPQLASRRQKAAFASVVAHELVHQWFGNYVTMQFWDDLWLNESFASWMGERAAATFDPTLHAAENNLRARDMALAADMLPSVRSIAQPVRTPQDVDAAFDVTTYLKGAAVLDMFDGYLGSTRMARGLSLHLARYRFANADANALFDSLSRGSGTDVAESFGSFIQQPGAPLVQASLSCSQKKGRLQLQQSRYTPLGTVSDRHSLWQVPVCWRAGDAAGAGERQCVLLTEAQQSIELPNCPAWLFPNAGGTGYYHFTVDRPMQEALRHATLTPPEQMAWASAQRAAFAAGKLQAHDLFESLTRAAQSSDLYVVSAALGSLLPLQQSLLEEDEGARAGVARFALAHFAPHAKGISLDAATPRTPSEEVLWPELLANLARLQALPKEQGRRLVDAGSRLIGYRGDGRWHVAGLSADLLPQAIASACDALGPAYLEALLDLLGHTDNATLRPILIGGLTRLQGVKEVQLLRQRLLGLPLRQNEWMPLLAGPMGSAALRHDHWRWFTEHFAEVRTHLPRKSLANLPRIAASFCSEQDALAVQAFFTPHLSELGQGKRELSQTLETIRQCAAQRDAHATDLQAQLQVQVHKAPRR